MWLALLPLAFADDAPAVAGRLVADAMRRQEARLAAEDCGNDAAPLAAAADLLEEDIQKDAASQAGTLANAALAITGAGLREARCAGRSPRVTLEMVISMERDALRERIQAAERQLIRWGERDAAAAWATLTAPALPPHGRDPRQPEGCRCMDELVRGLPIHYGYPTDVMELERILGLAALGGCVLEGSAPHTACPWGCYRDLSRPGESLAPLDQGWHYVYHNHVLLGVVGTHAAIERFQEAPPEAEALEPLWGCIDLYTLAASDRGEDGAWHPDTPADERGGGPFAAETCLSDWADAHLDDPELKRAAILFSL
ncbi:MAG: hypothetical protein H6739_01390 [Alphaproteobacteria bacterium]|nr:hypothetical protein [Alphaproteobacteria bacterium]